MFESAELGHQIDKAVYDKEVPKLREALLDAQFDLAAAKKFEVIILVGGVDGAGRSETVNLLNEWMDPRHIEVHGMGEPSDEERERPPMWRFWRVLPPKGRIGVFMGSWYSWPILDYVYGNIDQAAFHEKIERIVSFEKMLVAEGALLIKYWFHLSKQGQRKRLKALEKDPRTRWRVSKRDWAHFEMYDKFIDADEQALRMTSTAEAPWYIIEGSDARYRELTVGNILLEALRKRLDEKDGPVKAGHVPPLLPSIDQRHVLKSLDLSRRLSKKAYERTLEEQQGRLVQLVRDPLFKEISVVVVFEGNDAAGKGGSIRRITGALDARQYQVIPIAAPTEEERAHPYLWRFWRHLSRRGRISLFDRSWYGRVLVERVEGFAPEADWMRAYGEINDFEDQLARHDTVVVKFWLATSKEEQMRRFKEREQTGFKRYKITDEDWRNREKWDQYERAVCDMVERTSTDYAPWTLVESNDKYYARVKVLTTLCDRIEARLAERRKQAKRQAAKAAKAKAKAKKK
ncbi:polyphosphate:AMP phosphotransferase [Sulfuritortus calidifontis]|uniref:Polyphosphate:AMP phosphotransferase n=1 Tax=Sulfuritortus calidifontis TaxID=1914471 RepID=A0A4R3JXQ7_9PROT|nr:polyphosphate:AMP phosphotransferase [Sulfuritortus calidifontis]TCS73312.1 polyphosphate:AMP phosphotransferase [Sulfuritortus calidifontis]